jgi:hypothetical protein
MKKKRIILVISSIFVCSAFVLFYVLKPMKFIKAKHIKSHKCHEYVVLENYPSDKSVLKEKILEYQKNNIKKGCDDNRIIYLKDGNSSFWDFINEEDSYISKNPPSPDLDDFICEVYFYKTKHGNDTVVFNFYKDGYIEDYKFFR